MIYLNQTPNPASRRRAALMKVYDLLNGLDEVEKSDRPGGLLAGEPGAGGEVDEIALRNAIISVSVYPLLTSKSTTNLVEGAEQYQGESEKNRHEDPEPS